MPLTTYMGLLTLAPAVFGLLVLAAGLAKYPRAPLVIGLAVLGALIPAVCLPILSPVLSGGDLFLLKPLFGGAEGANAWFSAAYRLDGFGMYAAYGVVFIVAPLLLWLAFHGEVSSAKSAAAAAVTGEDFSAGPGGDDEIPAREGYFQHALLGPQWGGIALALLAESAALMVVFSDNVLWLALSWLALAALIWGLGEMGSDLQTLDRLGLGLMVAGPVLWLLAFMLPFLVGQSPRTVFPSLAYMMGRGGAAPFFVFVLAIALAVAAGAYPFLGWVRRRAALITPAGLAATVLLGLPVALFVGARTYGALQDANSLWPQIGQAQPPITAGVGMAVLGALTAAAAGLLALGRRDGRSLIALVAVAQAGWGLLALGTGTPASALGLTLLLATGVIGLGAMIAALYAGGVLLSDIEPESTGPRALGAPVRPLHLFAWTVGAATLVGAPLFAGFLPRQLTAAAALQARGLIVPLDALAWVGDGLLALALLRVTAPAFALALARVDPPMATSRLARWGLDVAGVPGAILALLALVAGIAPQALFAIGGVIGASALVQAGTPALDLVLAPLGYNAGGAQWLPALAWIVAVVVGVLLAFVLHGAARERRAVVLSGQRLGGEETLDRAQVVGLAEPEDAWSDLAGVFRSPWVSPGATDAGRGGGSGDEADAELDETTVDDVADAELPEVAEVEPLASDVGEDEVAETEPVEVTSADAMEEMPTADEVPPAQDGAVGEASVHEAESLAAEPAERAPAQAKARQNGAGDAAFVTRPRQQQRSGAGGKRGGRKGGRS